MLIVAMENPQPSVLGNSSGGGGGGGGREPNKT